MRRRVKKVDTYRIVDVIKGQPIFLFSFTFHNTWGHNSKKKKKKINHRFEFREPLGKFGFILKFLM